MNGKQVKRLRRAANRLTREQPEVSLTTTDGRVRKFNQRNVYKELKRHYKQGDLK